MRRSLTLRLAAVGVALLLALSAAACGGSKSSSTSTTSNGGTSTGTASNQQKVRFAKTKFVLHAGLAFGAFHRYIYKPLRDGTLKQGGAGHKAVVATKAGLAGLFSYHELRLAANAARGDPTLSKLIAPIDDLAAKLQSLANDLKQGRIDPAVIDQVKDQVGSLGQQSSQAGATVHDVTPPASLQPSG